MKTAIIILYVIVIIGFGAIVHFGYMHYVENEEDITGICGAINTINDAIPESRNNSNMNGNEKHDFPPYQPNMNTDRNGNNRHSYPPPM